MNNELAKLAESMNYISPMRYISGRITEYDISSANITMLRKYNKISEDYYCYLSKLPKYNREVEIGLLIQSDRSYYDIIRDGIIEAKKMLFMSNNIDMNNIVRIANDAVYINSSNDLTYTEFDTVVFKKKSQHNCMLRLDKLIFFLSFNYNTDYINIDIKGLNDNAINLHSNYLINSIVEAIYILERSTIDEALKCVQQLYENYIHLRLPKEYYRELTPESLYHYKDSKFYLMDIDTIDHIDINHNLYLIRELYSIILEKYNISVTRRN